MYVSSKHPGGSDACPVFSPASTSKDLLFRRDAPKGRQNQTKQQQYASHDALHMISLTNELQAINHHSDEQGTYNRSNRAVSSVVGQ